MSAQAMIESRQPREEAHGEGAPQGLPRLLSAIPHHGAMDLATHLEVHGELPATRRRRRELETIELVEQAGLTGRGGAAFPTAQKMHAVAAAGRRAAVVVNATEGEPASKKDQTLATRVPHLVLDGAVLAARALGAEEAIVGVCEVSGAAHDALAQAIAERAPARREPGLRLAPVPAGYVAGQESALVSFLNGGPALPRFTPPLPFERGVGGRPTFLSNAETFANVALIARHGPDWFRALGTAAEPGSVLVTLTGPLANPGVYEVEIGTGLELLIGAAGGLTERPRAALVGGYGGSWVGGAHLGTLHLCDRSLAQHGGTLGAGVVALLGERACPVGETVRIMRWLSDHSAGQCGPCVNGLHSLASELEKLAGGVAKGDHHKRLARLARMTRGRGACGHPDGAVKLLVSALDTFAQEISDHAAHGLCDGCLADPQLPFPQVSAR